MTTQYHPLTVGSLPRADKRPSVGHTSITQSTQLLTHLKFEASTFHLYHTTTMPPEAYCASEKRIQKAIETLFEGVYPSMRKCAEEMRLNQKTLNNQWNEKAFKIIRESINKRLITAQERAIKNYIIRMNEKNMSLTLKFVENVVNFVLREADSNATPLKRCWIKRFLDRNLDLKKQQQYSISIHRKDADWIFTLKQYFQQLKSVMNQYEIQILNTWNMNEIDFRIEYARNRVIITLTTKKSQSRMTDSDNCKYIIFVEVINVVGDIISFFLIFKKFFIAHRLTVNDFHWAITLIINEIAYSNDELIINWLQHFIKNVKNKRIDEWILLIYDEFEFHVIYHFFQLIIDNKIILF